MNRDPLRPFRRKLLRYASALLLLLLAACGQFMPTPLPPSPSSPPDTAQGGTSRPPSATPRPAQNSPQTPTPTLAPQIEVDPSQLDGLPIRFWHPWSGAAGEVAAQSVEIFNVTNEWGIQVEVVYQGSPDDLAGAVQLALDGPEADPAALPDLAAAFSHQALAWEALEPLVDLGPYVNDRTWGLGPEEQADFYPEFWEQDVSEGKRYGLPALRSGQALYYNQTWAEELGFSAPPAITEQFREQACAAALANRQDENPDNDTTGGYLAATDYDTVLGWVQAFGGEVTTPNGGSYDFDSDEAEASFTFLRSLLDQGCSWVLEDVTGQSEFANREALFVAGSVTSLSFQSEVLQAGENGDDWTVIPFPSPNAEPVVSANGSAYVLFPSTPERQLASWLFARWMAAPENQARFVQAQASLPIRASTLAALQEADDLEGQPQWQAALELLPLVRRQPSLESWGSVRWAVQDAATQLYRYYFTIDQVPNLLRLLDRTAADLHRGLPPGLITPTRQMPFITPES